MNQKCRLIAVFCAVLILSGCSLNRYDNLTTEAPVMNPRTSSSNADYTLYFPDDAPFSYTHSVSAEETVYIREIIKTNTTQISVTNVGESSVTCSLYYPEDLNEIIQTNTIEPGKTVTFSGLTSRFTYCIGFQAAEDGTVKASISG